MCEREEKAVEEIEEPEPTQPNCEPPDLYDRARQTEEALSDLDATEVEISLATMRERLASDPTEQSAFALLGALCLADAVIEQLSTKTRPYAVDGDVHYRHTSFAPGRSIQTLIEQLKGAEHDARTQRGQLLEPLAREIIAATSAARTIDARPSI